MWHSVRNREPRAPPQTYHGIRSSILIKFPGDSYAHSSIRQTPIISTWGSFLLSPRIMTPTWTFPDFFFLTGTSNLIYILIFHLNLLHILFSFSLRTVPCFLSQTIPNYAISLSLYLDFLMIMESIPFSLRPWLPIYSFSCLVSSCLICLFIF